MKNKILIDKIKFIFDALRVLICLPIGYLLYLFRNVYIVCERGTDARDNGYHIFKYITKEHPEKNVYYIIDKNSVDYHKVKALGRVIAYKSWKHVIYFIGARKKISSHVMGYAPGTPYRFTRIKRLLPIPGKHVFLQHGVIACDNLGLHADVSQMDIFICGAKPEYEFVKTTFGHPENVVRYTGLARYDALHGHTPKRDILIMPTWRMYLSDFDRDAFMRSDYFTHWDAVLRDPRISALLKENGVRLIFYPHYEMQKFVDCFTDVGENVVIADFNSYDVQQLLIDSSLLITDYSSVFFDFAYMKKPLIYYQFDKDTFFSRHYRKGYFDYEATGLGDVTLDIDSLIASIEKSVSLGFSPEQKYTERIEDLFILHDTDNCHRIYEAIEALK